MLPRSPSASPSSEVSEVVEAAVELRWLSVGDPGVRGRIDAGDPGVRGRPSASSSPNGSSRAGAEGASSAGAGARRSGVEAASGASVWIAGRTDVVNEEKN